MGSSVFQVQAKENSISGGSSLSTGIAVKPGQVLIISADPNETWKVGTDIGTGRGVSNANGLGNPLGGDHGFLNRNGQSFLYGCLVGSLDGGRTYFGVGTHLTMTILTKGTLTLHYWDENNIDNSGAIRVHVNVYEGPANVNPFVPSQK